MFCTGILFRLIATKVRSNVGENLFWGPINFDLLCLQTLRVVSHVGANLFWGPINFDLLCLQTLRVVSPDHGTKRIQVKTTEKITEFFKKVNIVKSVVCLYNIRRLY